MQTFFQSMFQVLSVCFNFWPFLIPVSLLASIDRLKFIKSITIRETLTKLPQSSNLTKKIREVREVANMLRNFLLLWGLWSVIRIILILNPDPSTSFLIQEPLNTILFLVTVGLLTYFHFVASRQLRWLMQGTRIVEQESITAISTSARVVDVIEKPNDWQSGEFLYRMKGDFRIGSMLLVKRGEVAVFYRNMKVLDVFGPGRHIITTANIPALVGLMGKSFSGQTPFSAEVYFVNPGMRHRFKWKTPAPLIIGNDHLGTVLITATGEFGVSVCDSLVFVENLASQNLSEYSREIQTFTNSILQKEFVDILATLSKDMSALYIIQHPNEIAAATLVNSRSELGEIGIDLNHFIIEGLQPLPDSMENLKAMGLFGKKDNDSFVTNSDIVGQARISGIPFDIYNDMYNVLIKCGLFKSDLELQAVFVDERIYAWHDQLLHADSPSQSVQFVINLLHNQYNKNGENALILFLYVLIDRINPTNLCYTELHELIERLKKIVQDVGNHRA